MGSVYVYTLSELFPLTAHNHANAAIRIHTAAFQKIRIYCMYNVMINLFNHNERVHDISRYLSYSLSQL